MAWGGRKLLVAPTDPPFTVDVARGHLRLDSDADDAVLQVLIGAAYDHVERYTGLAILPQTVAYTATTWGELIRLPTAPIGEVSIDYVDMTGAQQTLDPASYRLIGADTLEPGIGVATGVTLPALADRPDAITLSATAGFATIPPALKLAMLMLVADWFASREDTVMERGVTPLSIPNGVAALLSNYRVFA